MATCSNCGANVSDNAVFCPNCGQTVSAAGANQQQQQQYQQQNYQQQQQYQQYQQNYYKPKREAYVPEVDASDVQENKTISMFCYLSLMMVIPLIAKPDSKYIKYHANQALCLTIFYILCSLCMIVPFIGWFAGAIGYIYGFVCLIMGIVRALNGKMKPLPLIGNYNVLSYK